MRVVITLMSCLIACSGLFLPMCSSPPSSSRRPTMFWSFPVIDCISLRRCLVVIRLKCVANAMPSLCPPLEHCTSSLALLWSPPLGYISVPRASRSLSTPHLPP